MPPYRPFRPRCPQKLLAKLISVFLIIVFVAVMYDTIGSFKSKSLDTKDSDALLREQLLCEAKYLDLVSLDQKDPCVAKYIRKNHLIPPPPRPAYGESKAGVEFLGGTSFSKLIYKYFDFKTNGTFLEVGAYDGIASSNTHALEKIGWTGILIECNPFLVPRLKKSGRKAWISDACLSTVPNPQIVNFTSLKEWAASAQLWGPPPKEHQEKYAYVFDKYKNWKYFQLPAFPLYSIIMATQSFTKIDYLSLDVQGSEWNVLKNFPFQHFTFKVIIMEVEFFSLKKQEKIIELLEIHNYKLHMKMEDDIMFVYNKTADYY